MNTVFRIRKHTQKEQMVSQIEFTFAEAYTTFLSAKSTVENEVSFYSSKGYQVYYDYHFRNHYKIYKNHSLDDLDDDEEVCKSIRIEFVQHLRMKKTLELQDYKICCELDAELDAIHAAYRRRFRVNSA